MIFMRLTSIYQIGFNRLHTWNASLFDDVDHYGAYLFADIRNCWESSKLFIAYYGTTFILFLFCIALNSILWILNFQYTFTFLNEILFLFGNFFVPNTFCCASVNSTVDDVCLFAFLNKVQQNNHRKILHFSNCRQCIVHSGYLFLHQVNLFLSHFYSSFFPNKNFSKLNCIFIFKQWFFGDIDFFAIKKLNKTEKRKGWICGWYQTKHYINYISLYSIDTSVSHGHPYKYRYIEVRINMFELGFCNPYRNSDTTIVWFSSFADMCIMQLFLHPAFQII